MNVTDEKLASSEKPVILVVDDDLEMVEICRLFLNKAGYEILCARSGEEALQSIIQHGNVKVVLSDLKMPGMDGITLLKKARKVRPEIQFVIMTAFGSIKNAVKAIKLGAFGYIPKPFKKDELLRTIKKALLQVSVLENKSVSELRVPDIPGDRDHISGFVASSETMADVVRHIKSAAPNTSTVLITGESGTGKELVARAIHEIGATAAGPFMSLNCAALPEGLVETEFFGHAKGAYTGAVTREKGLFEAAEGGTIFLDEIAEMSVAGQAKLLRTLQDRKVRLVGETSERPINVRIIAATNTDVSTALKQGRLRIDLYYRLSVIAIHLPPLRERLSDIPLLVEHFINKFSDRYTGGPSGFTPEAWKVLENHPWPGNVRELENLMESFFASGYGGKVNASIVRRRFEAHPVKFITETADEKVPVQSIKKTEKLLIKQAIATTGGNKERAAKILGISRATLYRKIKEFRIE